MTAAEVIDVFLALYERADTNVNVDVDARAAREAVGIHAPTVFTHMNELRVRGWIEDSPPSPVEEDGSKRHGGRRVETPVKVTAVDESGGCLDAASGQRRSLA